MLRLQAFKFALQPNGERLRNLRQFAGSCRFVYNKGLALNIERYEKKEKRLGYAGLCALLPNWKREHEFLSDVPAQALQQALQNLERAYTKFAAKSWSRNRKVKIQMDGLALSGAIRQPGGITSGLLVTRDKRKARRPFTVAFELSDSIQTPLLASYLVRAVAVLERHFLQRHTSKVRRATFVANHAGSLRGCFRPSFSTAMQRL